MSGGGISFGARSVISSKSRAPSSANLVSDDEVGWTLLVYSLLTMRSLQYEWLAVSRAQNVPFIVDHVSDKEVEGCDQQNNAAEVQKPSNP
eukprot:scaffold234948_cov22-Tisochrysis_lutea.AAC.2